MNENRKLKKRKLRLWVRISFIIGCTIISLALLNFILFYNQIQTISSIGKISNAPAYELTYHGDYKFDKYLETSATTEVDLNLFLKNNLLYRIGNLDYKDHGCTGFYATTPDGNLIFARNFDAQAGTAAVLKTAAGYKSVSMSDLSWCGWDKSSDISISEMILSLASPYLITDGMNENGVAAAVFTLKDPKTSADRNVTTINDLTVLRLVLDKATCVDEAIELMKQYNTSLNLNTQSHYMIADANGNSAIIEYIAEKMKIIYKKGSYQIISNFLLYDNDNPILVGDGTDDRYWNYDSALSKTKGIISTENALALLKKNTVKGLEQWSVVYNLTQKTMSVTFYGDYENVYTYAIE